MLNWFKRLFTKEQSVARVSNTLDECTICRQPNVTCIHRDMKMHCKRLATVAECITLLALQSNTEKIVKSTLKPYMPDHNRGNVRMRTTTPTTNLVNDTTRRRRYDGEDDDDSFATGVAVGLAIDAFSFPRSDDSISAGGGSFGGGGSSGSWSDSSSSGSNSSSSHDSGSSSYPSDSSSDVSGDSCGGCD